MLWSLLFAVMMIIKAIALWELDEEKIDKKKLKNLWMKQLNFKIVLNFSRFLCVGVVVISYSSKNLLSV